MPSLACGRLKGRQKEKNHCWGLPILLKLEHGSGERNLVASAHADEAQETSTRCRMANATSRLVVDLVSQRPRLSPEIPFWLPGSPNPCLQPARKSEPAFERTVRNSGLDEISSRLGFFAALYAGVCLSGELVELLAQPHDALLQPGVGLTRYP